MKNLTVSATHIGELTAMFYETDRVPMFVGKPGIAKTAMVREAAKIIGKKYDCEIPVIELHLASLSEVDVRGYLIPNGDQAVFTKPVFWSEVEKCDRGIVFLDEFPQATHEVQKAIAPFILDRRIGQFELPPGWRIVIAGNGTEDNAGANTLLSHVLNRMSYVEVKAPDPDMWAIWAINNDLCPEVIAFAKLRPNAVFDTKQPESGDTPWCTPRSLHAASDIAKASPGGLRAMVGSEVGMAVLSGTIGSGATAELAGVVKIAMDLPSFEEIIADPEGARVPEDLSQAYAAVMLIAVRAKPDVHGEAAITYVTRFKPNIGLTGIISLMSRDKNFVNSKRLQQWIKDNRQLLAKFQSYISVR